MSTIDSSSTYAEVEAALADNASWFEDQSAIKAGAYVTAATEWLRQTPVRAGHAGADMEHAVQQIEKRMLAAQRYAAANAGVASGGAGIKHVDFRDLRA